MNSNTCYLNIIYNRGNIIENSSSYLHYDNGSGYLKFAQLCKLNKKLNVLINYDALFPKSFDKFFGTPLKLYKLSIDKIVLFFTSILAIESNYISDFIEIKKQYENDILNKNYSHAEKLICEAYEKFGISLWIIDSCSILQTLAGIECSLLKQIKKTDLIYYKLFCVKNNFKERHEYYLKHMGEIFDASEGNDAFWDYLKYSLFIKIPNNIVEWKNLLLSVCRYSLIDIYLVITDYLQHYSEYKNNYIRTLCYNNIVKIRNPKHQIFSQFSCALQDESFIDTHAAMLIESFKNRDYENVQRVFFSQGSGLCSSFNACRYVALSYLLSTESPISNTELISANIIYNIYTLLEKNESNHSSATNYLSTVSRILRTFDIHKGICLFLEAESGLNCRYFFHEQVSCIADLQIIKYELENDDPLIIPNKIINNIPTKLNLNDYFDYILVENNNCHSTQYFQEAFIVYTIKNLINDNNINRATDIFIEAYIENKLLITNVDVTKIKENIEQNYAENKPLTLEQLCYVFIDSKLKEIRRDCFLNLFDNTGFETPLELADKINNTSEAVVCFFLDTICSASTLTDMYRLFTTSEEVENYRIKICEYLIDKEYCRSKLLLKEVEIIKKNRMLSQKLLQVEKSRLSINIDSFKAQCFDKIVEEVNRYNSSRKIYMVEFDNNKQMVLKELDNRNKILKNIYYIYCKEFCYGNFGLDISLSTRVRHGTFSNQILKVFSDNNMICNGHGTNSFFEGLEESKSIAVAYRKVLLDFVSKLQDNLQYFTQHTLKVVLDNPIYGAIFCYDLSDNELNPIFDFFKNANRINADEVIWVTNNFLITKTNDYLRHIRDIELPRLRDTIINELTMLSSNIKTHIPKLDDRKMIERLFVNCRTGIQKEFETISRWFYISDFYQWEDYSFTELIEMCCLIGQSLFTDFGKTSISGTSLTQISFKGETFRSFVDVILILLENAIIHSGFKDNLCCLKIKYSLIQDSNYLYISLQNNLSDKINIIELDKTVEKINNDFNSKEYLNVNTRQEGGMGLYKIMYAIFSIQKYGEQFYVSRNENIFRVEIKLKKENVAYEKHTDC